MQNALDYLWEMQDDDGQNGYSLEIEYCFKNNDNLDKLKLSIKNYLKVFDNEQDLVYLKEYFN